MWFHGALGQEGSCLAVSGVNEKDTNLIVPAILRYNAPLEDLTQRGFKFTALSRPS